LIFRIHKDISEGGDLEDAITAFEIAKHVVGTGVLVVRGVMLQVRANEFFLIIIMFVIFVIILRILLWGVFIAILHAALETSSMLVIKTSQRVIGHRMFNSICIVRLNESCWQRSVHVHLV
jgi:hypothetical protein